MVIDFAHDKLLVLEPDAHPPLHMYQRSLAIGICKICAVHVELE